MLQASEADEVPADWEKDGGEDGASVPSLRPSKGKGKAPAAPAGSSGRWVLLRGFEGVSEACTSASACCKSPAITASF